MPHRSHGEPLVPWSLVKLRNNQINMTPLYPLLNALSEATPRADRPACPRGPLQRVIDRFPVLIAIAVLAPRLAVCESYQISDLGTLGGEYSYACGINDSGQVVGYSQTTTSHDHAFLYDDGALTDLGTLGGTSSYAYAINANHSIVGTTSLAGERQSHAFVYANGSMRDLGSAGSGSNIVAFAINALGQIAGRYELPDLSTHPFVYSNDVFVDLGTLGGTNGTAYGINNLGEVVGASTIFTNAPWEHAFLFDTNGIHDLGSLGGYQSAAYAINDAGQAVGYGDDNDYYPHTSIYDSTNGLQFLGGDFNTAGGAAYGINSLGEVAQAAVDSVAQTTNAYVYSNGNHESLTDMIPTNSGWNLVEARAINDIGQIAGSGTLRGKTHAFLLTPIRLSTTLSAGGIVLSWPSALNGFGLQATTNILGSGWAQITNTPIVVGARNTVTEDTVGSTRFFRLNKMTGD